MIAAIQQHLVPLGVQLPQSDRQVIGGYFLWLALPPSLNGTILAQRAKEQENLIVAHGELFEVPGDTDAAPFPHAVRLSFAWEDEDQLAEGIARLAVVVRAMLQEKQQQEEEEGEGYKEGEETRGGRKRQTTMHHNGTGIGDHERFLDQVC